jgi:hypothetical protein
MKRLSFLAMCGYSDSCMRSFRWPLVFPLLQRVWIVLRITFIVFEDIVVGVSDIALSGARCLRWPGKRPGLNEDVLNGRLQFADVLFDPSDGGLQVLNIESTLESDFERQ